MNSQLRRTICLPYPFQMYFCSLIDMIAWGFNFDQMDPVIYNLTIIKINKLELIGNFTNYHYAKR